ncbi:MAG: DUF6159 family protein [Chloroflexi bacterium]|nr:DUF6159 family protein [Chloroflexota bacterium]
MFAAIGRSFRLIKESYRLLRHDPELIWLTVGSFVAVGVLVLVLGGFGMSIGVIDADTESVKSSGFVLLGLGYFLTSFVIIYFQVALVAAVMHRMDGGDPDLSYAISQANHRLGAILIWALISATVGLILKVLENAARGQENMAGRIIASIVIGLLGFAWSLMVFFVIPVIVAEDAKGFQAIKRSSSTLKAKWGEAVIGNQGIGLITFLAIFVFAGVPVFLGMMALNSSVALGGGLIVVGAAIGMFIAAAGSALDSTYRAVLYEYATKGEVGGFSREVIDTAFRPKNDIRGGF